MASGPFFCLINLFDRVKRDRPAAIAVEIFSVSGQFSFSWNHDSAFGTCVLDDLAWLVSLAIIAMIDLGIRTKIAHRLLPSRTMVESSSSESGKCQQVGILMDERGSELFSVIQNMLAQSDRECVRVCSSSGGAISAPFDFWSPGQRMRTHQAFEAIFGKSVQEVRTNWWRDQNPPIPPIIPPPPPKSSAIPNHFLVLYLSQISWINPSVFLPAWSITSLAPFISYRSATTSFFA